MQRFKRALKCSELDNDLKECLIEVCNASIETTGACYCIRHLVSANYLLKNPILRDWCDQRALSDEIEESDWKILEEGLASHYGVDLIIPADFVNEERRASTLHAEEVFDGHRCFSERFPPPPGFHLPYIWRTDNDELFYIDPTPGEFKLPVEDKYKIKVNLANTGEVEVEFILRPEFQCQSAEEDLTDHAALEEIWNSHVIQNSARMEEVIRKMHEKTEEGKGKQPKKGNKNPFIERSKLPVSQIRLRPLTDKERANLLVKLRFKISRARFKASEYRDLQDPGSTNPAKERPDVHPSHLRTFNTMKAKVKNLGCTISGEG